MSKQTSCIRNQNMTEREGDRWCAE